MAGRLNRLLAVAANTFRETVRERVLYNLIIFALLMMGWLASTVRRAERRPIQME